MNNLANIYFSRAIDRHHVVFSFSVPFSLDKNRWVAIVVQEGLLLCYGR